MADSGFYPCSGRIPESPYVVSLSHATRNSRMRNNTIRFCGQGREEQLWENLFSKPSEWWDNRLDKRSPRHPDFRHKATREPLWLNNQKKPVWVDSRLASLGTQVESGLWQFQRQPVRPSGPGDSIKTYCEEGQLDMALEVLLSMDQQHVVPSPDMYSSLLKACAKRKALVVAKRVHVHLAQQGLDFFRVLGELVVTTFVKCGDFQEALELFDRLPHRTVVSWTAIISGYTRGGLGQMALKMYAAMRQQGLEPNKYTLVSLLKACGSIPDLEAGKLIHANAVKCRLDSDLFVGTCLVDMYAKCGSITDAQDVFDNLTQRDVVSWTAMIAAYAQQGDAAKALQVYEEMLEDGVSPDSGTFVNSLQACGLLAGREVNNFLDGQPAKVSSLEKGKAIHADAERKGYRSNLFIRNTLISMYGRCGSLVDAQNVFDRMSQRDVVSWNTILAAYVELGQAEKALEVYEQMLLEGGAADVRTFLSVLQACGTLADKVDLADGGQLTKEIFLGKGKLIHSMAWVLGFGSDEFVGSALISMYGKCGSIVDAKNVFDGMSRRGVVLWNAMLAAYVAQAQAEKALQLFEQMQEDCVSPSYRTFVSALRACGMCAEKEADVMVDGQWTKIKSLTRGKTIHADTRELGYDSDTFVASTLISMYGKCGSILDAQNVFYALCKRDVVSWTAMLGAYVEQGQGEKAFEVYSQMQGGGVSPDKVTLVCILQACSNSGNLDICRQIHRTQASPLDSILASTLIHAYGKCGSMVEAQMVFDAIPQPNVVSWNALIAGYGRQGNDKASFQCYEDMKLAGVKPNGVTFLSILTACCHSGLVEKGVEYFESMSKDYCITPEIEHYVSMVDLLGRAGYFTRVEDLLSTMAMEPDRSMCLCLLGACRKHGKIVLAKRVFDRAVHLHPEDSAAYVLMSNIYSDASLWDHAEKVMDLEQRAGAWKKPGQSWIEHEQEVHKFMVEDSKHPMQKQLYDYLRSLSVELEL